MSEMELIAKKVYLQQTMMLQRPYRIHESGESKTDPNLNSNPNQNTHPNLIPKP